MAAAVHNISTLPAIAEETSQMTINTAHFAPRDLSLFIESMEIIARLEREKEQRKHNKLNKKVKSDMHSDYAASSTDCSVSAPSTDEAEDEPVLHLEAKKLPATPYKNLDFDETYFSGTDEGSRSSSPRCSQIFDKISNSTAYSSSPIYASCLNTNKALSDSEESGVFPIGESTDYECITPLRPRSQVITKKPKSRTIRSRIISMVLKRDYVHHKNEDKYDNSCSSSTVSSKSSIEDSNERVDRVLQEVIHHQYESLNSLKKKKSRSGFACDKGSPEERFLDKALRYLTL